MNVRKYGKAPYGVAVLHGGPGAPGYMAPVARELGRTLGVLEPLQTKGSLHGQIEELRCQLASHADLPVVLIGSSWGAVVALFLAAGYKEMVDKLILVGSAVFDAANSSQIEARRLERLTRENRQRYETITGEMERASGDKRRSLMKEWGEILFDTDVYDPLTRDLEVMEHQYEVLHSVWSDFVALRDQPGSLKSEFSKIGLPTVVIHGEYDPHPIEGIRPFLEDCLRRVRFHILPECGHYPWVEKRARERFFDILRSEL
jgi:pimeloyl-ACP methyl ester carboxylesterase